MAFLLCGGLCAGDAVPPRIVSLALAPAHAVTVASVTAVTIGFSEVVAAASIGSGTVQLIRSGGDAVFGDGDDVVIQPASVALTSATTLRLDLTGVTLPNDTYRVRLVGSRGLAALRFDGNGQLATMLDTAVLDPTAAITLECWFAFETGGNWNPRMIERDFYNIGTTGTGTQRPVGVGFGLEGTTLIDTGTWHHVALSAVGGGDWRLYLDGVLEDTIAAQPIPASAIPLRLGRSRTVGFDHYRGRIDEVRVWSIARTQADIRATMTTSLRGDEAGLIGYWRCDEGVGQAIADATGRGTTCHLGDSAAIEANDATWDTAGAPLSGLTDLAGNALDGELTGGGALPSGDGLAGGDALYSFALDSTLPPPTTGGGVGGAAGGITVGDADGTQNFICGSGAGAAAVLIALGALLVRRSGNNRRGDGR